MLAPCCFNVNWKWTKETFFEMLMWHFFGSNPSGLLRTTRTLRTCWTKGDKLDHWSVEEKWEDNCWLDLWLNDSVTVNRNISLFIFEECAVIGSHRALRDWMASPAVMATQERMWVQPRHSSICFLLLWCLLTQSLSAGAPGSPRCDGRARAAGCQGNSRNLLIGPQTSLTNHTQGLVLVNELQQR